MRRYLNKALVSMCFSLFSLQSTGSAYEFVYKDVYACSTSKFEFSGDIDLIQALNTYVIHTSAKDQHISIIFNHSEYSTFKQIESTYLYVQAGGLRWLEAIKIDDNITRFSLHTETKEDKFFTTLLFDKSSLSAVVKGNLSEDSKLLMCWDHLNN